MDFPNIELEERASIKVKRLVNLADSRKRITNSVCPQLSDQPKIEKEIIPSRQENYISARGLFKSSCVLLKHHVDARDMKVLKGNTFYPTLQILLNIHFSNISETIFVK